MDSSERIEPAQETPHWRGYAWGVLAALTCPCHLPILAAVLAGTTLGAFIGDHWGVAAVALAALFFLSLARAIRAFRGSA